MCQRTQLIAECHALHHVREEVSWHLDTLANRTAPATTSCSCITDTTLNTTTAGGSVVGSGSGSSDGGSRGSNGTGSDAITATTATDADAAGSITTAAITTC